MRKPQPESPIGTAPPERPGDAASRAAPPADPRLGLFDDADPATDPAAGSASPSHSDTPVQPVAAPPSPSRRRTVKRPDPPTRTAMDSADPPNGTIVDPADPSSGASVDPPSAPVVDAIDPVSERIVASPSRPADPPPIEPILDPADPSIRTSADPVDSPWGVILDPADPPSRTIIDSADAPTGTIADSVDPPSGTAIDSAAAASGAIADSGDPPVGAIDPPSRSFDPSPPIDPSSRPIVDAAFESPAPAVDSAPSIDPHLPTDRHPQPDPTAAPRPGDDADARTPDFRESPRVAYDPDATVLEPHTIVVRTTSRARESTAEAPQPAASAPPPPPPPPAPPIVAARPVFTFDPLRPYRGVVRRFFIVYRHVLGLLAGAAVAYVRNLPPEQRRGLHSWFPRLAASVFWPFLNREIRRLPFAQQLRRRLEILGPTYIKLGQIMAIREDLLPRNITSELQNLFDRLPAVPFPQVRERIENSLRAPLETLFRRVEEQPLGSASIAQAHLAETLEGEKVVVKVIKPGVRGMIESDLTLLRMVGGFLQWVLPRYQPRQIIQEFSAYTRKEVDYTFEADNAETFAANFRDMPDVVFPRIYRSLSSTEVLTMEFIRGFKPGSEPTADLTPDERAQVVDLGAASIIRMLYRDGFFHADLHAGNLMILPGKRVRMAFIDLGMVGRFEDRTRRQMLYYFHALVTGDIDGATRYLVDMARFGKGGDPNGFRRAVADLSRRFVGHASRGDISIAQLILASVGMGGRYRVFFPVEMTLMVKALVTFEGVGRMLDPRLDVASVSQKHVSKIFQQQFDPRTVLRQLLRGSPELVDMAVRLPQLLAAGFRVADEHLNNPTPSNPLAGVRGSILSAACIMGGVIAVIQGSSPLLWGGMFILAVLLAVFGK